MKRVFALLFTVLICFSMTACSPTDSELKQFEGTYQNSNGKTGSFISVSDLYTSNDIIGGTAWLENVQGVNSKYWKEPMKFTIDGTTAMFYSATNPNLNWKGSFDTETKTITFSTNKYVLK